MYTQKLGPAIDMFEENVNTKIFYTDIRFLDATKKC